MRLVPPPAAPPPAAPQPSARSSLARLAVSCAGLLSTGVYSTAMAAPLAPVALQTSPFSIEVAGRLNTDRLWLRSPGCDTDACTAVRTEAMQGGEVDIRLIPPLGVYANLEHLKEVNSAAIFSGTGWGGAGGVKGSLPLGPGWGINGWAGAEVGHTSTGASTKGTSSFQVSRRLYGEGGLNVHVGAAQEGFVWWFGADVIALSNDRTLILDNSVDLSLVPAIPGSLTSGLLIASLPLGGPWMERGRLGAGVSGSVGFRTGLQMWISGSY